MEYDGGGGGGSSTINCVPTHKGAFALRFPNGDLLTDVNLKLDEYCISLRDAVRRVRTQQGSEQA